VPFIINSMQFYGNTMGSEAKRLLSPLSFELKREGKGERRE
jgi:hypothetical protein